MSLIDDWGFEQMGGEGENILQAIVDFAGHEVVINLWQDDEGFWGWESCEYEDYSRIAAHEPEFTSAEDALNACISWRIY